MMKCITCGNSHSEKFCPNCGEKAETKKITLTSIVEEAFTSITSMDRGFLFNIKMLIRNPKKIVFEYIDGKRKGIMNPISFLVIALSIYLIADVTFWNQSVPKETYDKSDIGRKSYDIGVAFGKFVNNYFNYFFIFTAFLLANSTRLLFQRFNYVEHLAINFFICGLATLASTLLFLVSGIPLIFNPFLYGVIFLLTFRIFRTEKNKSEIWVLTITSFIVFLIQFVITIVTIGYFAS